MMCEEHNIPADFSDKWKSHFCAADNKWLDGNAEGRPAEPGPDEGRIQAFVNEAGKVVGFTILCK